MPRKFGSGGCAYVVDDGEQCGAPRRRGSPYCPAHHTICYIARGSRAEAKQCGLIEAIANAVGGKFAGVRNEPPSVAFVRWIDGLLR